MLCLRYMNEGSKTGFSKPKDFDRLKDLRAQRMKFQENTGIQPVPCENPMQRQCSGNRLWARRVCHDFETFAVAHPLLTFAISARQQHQGIGTALGRRWAPSLDGVFKS